MSKEVFRRKEIKYVLSKKQYNLLMTSIEKYLEKDIYYKSTICNIYFDTENYDLIIHSLDKPLYKQKIRLRSYNIPNMNDNVYLEIKKKFEGIVSKRRISLSLKDFYKYINTGNIDNVDNQVKGEIDYCFSKYNLKPVLFLAYDRLSYLDKTNNSFRITFDTNIRSREKNLKLELGDEGKLFFDDDTYIMETKTLGSYPLWFTNVLSSLKIYPMSFSKYGNIYRKKIKEELYV